MCPYSSIYCSMILKVKGVVIILVRVWTSIEPFLLSNLHTLVIDSFRLSFVSKTDYYPWPKFCLVTFPKPLMYVWTCLLPLYSTISPTASSIRAIWELKSNWDLRGISESVVIVDKVESAIESKSSSVCLAFKRWLKLIESGIVVSGSSNLIEGRSRLEKSERRHMESVGEDFFVD